MSSNTYKATSAFKAFQRLTDLEALIRNTMNEGRARLVEDQLDRLSTSVFIDAIQQCALQASRAGLGFSALRLNQLAAEFKRRMAKRSR